MSTNINNADLTNVGAIIQSTHAIQAFSKIGITYTQIYSGGVFINMPDSPVTGNITISTGSNLLAVLDTCFTGYTTYAIECAVRVNGVDNSVGQFVFDTAGQHHSFTGATVITGLPAGTYNATARWRVTNGAFFAPIIIDSSDYICLRLEEF